MLETILSAGNFVKTVVSYGFHISFKAGQILVTFINFLLENVSAFVKNLLITLTIILESFSIFIQDVVQGFHQVLAVLAQVFEVISSGISSILNCIENTVEGVILIVIGVYDFIFNCVLTVFTSIEHILIFFKRLVVLFGSGVWFAITLIPLFIVYLCTLCTYYIGRIFEELTDMIFGCLSAAKISLKNTYNFVTDVPLESVAGIIIGLSLAYIFTQFYIIIFSYLYQQLHQTILIIKNKAQSILSRILTRETEDRVPRISARPRISTERRRVVITPRRAINGSKSTENLDKKTDVNLCVICQERVMCVLLLPCKHLCFCNECNRELRFYNYVCPICRNDIESTMEIFMV